MTNYEDENQSESFTEMRGVCSFEYNGTTIFVKAKVEDVACSLSEERNANLWQQNIIDQEVELAEQCFFVFRFNGHTWTNIIARDHLVVELLISEEAKQLSRETLQQRIQQARSLELNKDDARLLSMRLKTRAIYYGVSDTARALSYRIYENGELLERLVTGEGYEILEWESTLHDVSAEQIGEDVEGWIEQLFRENDALEPSMSFMYWVGYVMHRSGHKITTSDAENTLERADFVAL